MGYCQNCGMSLENSDEFCTECGERQEKREEHNNHRFCEECGTEIVTGESFCTNCGQPIYVSASKNFFDEISSFQSTNEKKVLQTEIYANQQSVDENKKRTNIEIAKLVLLSLLIIAIVSLGVFEYFLFSDRSRKIEDISNEVMLSSIVEPTPFVTIEPTPTPTPVSTPSPSPAPSPSPTSTPTPMPTSTPTPISIPTPEPAPVDEFDGMPLKYRYKEILQEYENNFPESEYFTPDVDGDGIKELFVLSGDDSEAGRMIDIYTIRNNNVEYLDSIGMGTASIRVSPTPSGAGEMYIAWGRGGWYALSQILLENNTIILKEIIPEKEDTTEGVRRWSIHG